MLGILKENLLEKTIWEVGFFKNIIEDKNKFLELKHKEFSQLEGIPIETHLGRRLEVEFISNVYHSSGKVFISCSIRDITERIRDKELLIESKTLLTNILESTHDAFFAMDDEFVVTYFNKAAEIFLHQKRIDVVGRNLFDVFPEARGSVFEENYTKAVREKIFMTFEVFFGIEPYKDWYDVRIYPQENGISVYFLITTEQKNAENALRKSEEEQRFALYGLNTAQYLSKMGSWKWDIKNNKVYWSDEMYRIFCIDKESFTGKLENVIRSVIHPDDLYVVLPENAVEFSKNDINEYRIILPDKSIRHIQAKAGVTEFDNSGNPIFFSGIAQDITERKLAEEKIINEKLFSDMVIESLPGIFYMFDSNFTPLKWNRNKSELLGLTDEEMKTHNTLDFIADEDKEKVIESFKKVFIDGESEEIVSIIRHDGQECSYHLTGKRLDTIDGPMLLGVGIDVSQRTETEKKLVKALIKAEESDNLKTAFLQNMSHEIRTPLNGIIGFTRLLNEENISKEEFQEFTSIIQQSGNRLIEIVDNVLDMSRIETGQVNIVKKAVIINSVFSQLLTFFSPLANSKNIILNFHESEDINFSIFTDEAKLYQILANLVNNAIKFTKSGSIDFGFEIKAKPSSGYTNEGVVLFYIKDTGIGIDLQFHERIFDRFTQAETSIGRNYEGAGLGLAICKGLVKLLGGNIWLESCIDKGTTFYFTLPYNSVEQTSRPISKNNEHIIKSIKGKILIVEDDSVSFMLLNILLSDTDIIVIHAENGQQAVEIVRNNPDVDLILMDIRMPVMDGMEATRQIKKIRPELPIIAQTAYAFAGEIEMILAAGCNDCLSKPIEEEKLNKLLNLYLK